MNSTVQVSTPDLLARANALAGNGRWAEAEHLLTRLLALEPGHFGARLRLCDALLAQRRCRDARETALAIHAMAPDKPSILVALMMRLRLFNECEAIFACLDRLSPAGMNIDQLIGSATVLGLLGEEQRALDWLEAAPAEPPTLLLRGQLLGHLGRIAEAGQALDRCIADAPELARAHWLLANLRKATAETHHVDALREQLQLARDPLDRAQLAFALHKELDDLDDFQPAWKALAQANAIRRATVRYSTAESVRLTDALIAHGNPGFLAGQGEPAGATPIFIVGMHRSGTTLMERILGGHPDIAAAGELYDFPIQMRQATDHYCNFVLDETIVARAGDADFAAIGQQYLDFSRWRTADKPFFTDKLPSNFLHIGFIAKALPQARIIHMVRDPMDTCLSNLRELYSDACLYSYDQRELADYWLAYQRLMAHWHEVLPGRILDVRYEDLVDDGEAQTRAVLDFCGLPFAPGMLAIENNQAPVSTASSIQVRQPIHRASIGRWRRYESQLGTLHDRLGKSA